LFEFSVLNHTVFSLQVAAVKVNQTQVTRVLTTRFYKNFILKF